jgi:hypothetical protein
MQIEDDDEQQDSNFEQFASKYSQFKEYQHETYLLYLDLMYAKRQPLQSRHKLTIKAYPSLKRYCIHAQLSLPIGKRDNVDVVDEENPLTQVDWKSSNAIFVPVKTNEQYSFASNWKLCRELDEKNNSISFAFVDSDSTISYYKISSQNIF